MRGAMLITISSLISRLLGALYRPVAQIYLGDRGLALVTPPSAAYMIIMAISSVGLNVAISRLISERLAVLDYSGARRVLKVSTWMLVGSGAAFALIFALGARWLAAVQGFPEAWPGFLVLAPAIFLVSLLSAFRGLYQGMQQMRPSAVSQVVEQAGRVGLGLLLVALATPVALNYGAAGFNAGSTIGILLGVLYSAWVFLRERPTALWTTSLGPGSYATESVLALMRKVLAIALPLSMIGAVLPLTQQIDALIVTNRLISIGVAEGAARDALAYLMNAGTLRDLPSILTTALYVSLVPAVTESAATGRLDQARHRTAMAFRIALLVGLPATVGLLVVPREAYGVLFTGQGYTVMAPLALSTLFLMLQQISSGTLQGLGLVWVSVRHLLLGIVVKSLLTYWWTGLPGLLAGGAAFATSAAFLVAAGLNLWALSRRLGLGLRVRNDIGRPAAAAAVMAMGLWLISPLVHQVLPYERLAGLVILMSGGIIYAVTILLVGGLSVSDVAAIPWVKPALVEWMRRYRLLRDDSGRSDAS